MGTSRRAFRPAHGPRRNWGGRLLRVSGAIGFALLASIAIWPLLPRVDPVSNASQPRGGPRLGVDRDLIDFGVVAFGQMVRARFHVRNAGDQPLRLTEAPEVEAVEGC